MHEITFCDCMSLCSQVCNSIGHVDHVPSHHRIGHEREARSLVRLIFWLMLSKQSLVGEKEEQPERVQSFSFVELGINATSIVPSGTVVKETMLSAFRIISTQKASLLSAKMRIISNKRLASPRITRVIRRY